MLIITDASEGKRRIRLPLLFSSQAVFAATNRGVGSIGTQPARHGQADQAASEATFRPVEAMFQPIACLQCTDRGFDSRMPLNLSHPRSERDS